MSVKLEEDIQVIWMLLFQIVADVEKRIAALIARHQLTPPQFYVLKTLMEHGGSCAIGQIAREHHLTNATMTGLVKRLENMQPPLVKRDQSDHDRRSIVVSMTDAGLGRFTDVRDELMNHVKEMVTFLDEQGRENLIEYASFYVMQVVHKFPVSDVSQS